MLGVRLPKELDERLTRLSKETHVPKSYYVKDALQQYLDEYEEDLKAVEEYKRQKKNGTLVTIPLEEIKKKFDLD